jgi:hypothetical protein
MVSLVDGVPLGIPSPPAPDAPDAAPIQDGASGEPFDELVRNLSRALDAGEALVSNAHRAAFAPMDAGTLIALQAGIYRYAEAVDLTAKIVDRGTAAVRTVLQGGH